MLVFVDESGDTGSRVAQGSSEFFTVTLVVFEENEEAQAADARITALRQELGKADGFEFHFQENSDRLRKAFLEAAARCNFYYFGFVINKQRLFGLGFSSGEAFYKYVCGLVFENAKPYLNNAIVRIDASGGRKFQQQLAAYLKTRINEESAQAKHIKKVASEDSRQNNLLQLADMVCGAIARSYRTDKKDPQAFRKIIKQREISVVLLPEE